MQCPFCGSTDLLPKFKFCPECAEPLPRANVPKEDQDAGRTEQPSPPGNNGGFEVDNKQRQGKRVVLGDTSSILCEEHSLFNPSRLATANLIEFALSIGKVDSEEYNISCIFENI